MKHAPTLSNAILKHSPKRLNFGDRSLSLDSASANSRKLSHKRSKILDPNSKRPIFYGATYGGSSNKNNDNNDLECHSEQAGAHYPSVSDIIGSFGWFQFLVLLFSGIREGGVGYDAVVMSIILQPERNFLCADNVAAADREWLSVQLARDKARAEFTSFNDSYNDQCFKSDGSSSGEVLRDSETGLPVKCKSWIFPKYDPAEGPSLVAEWSLVCDQHWLVAFIESAYFFGLVSGNLVWGLYADRAGRRRAYLIAHTVAVVSGFATIFAPTIELFAICRFLSAFGSIGYNIIYSIQVEIIGSEHRSFSTTINHLGWGLGVICVPFTDHMFQDYRYIIAVAPVVGLIIFPWAFWLPESSRWLMANNQFGRARQELIRAAEFNGRQSSPLIEEKIALLNEKITTNKLLSSSTTGESGGRGQQQSIKQSYRLLFKNPILVKDTIILAFISFVGHLFYYMLTINFGYMKNLSLEANFITSGAGEWVAVIVGAILLKFCSRKTCLTLFLFIMAASFGTQALIDSELAPSLDTTLIVTTNNGLSTLSSLLLIFVALIVNQEVYPTVIRQTGSSIVNTIGESGSTLAPPAIHTATRVGLWKADLFYVIVCVFAMIGTQFLTKTDDIELADT